MATVVKMPKWGLTMTEGTVTDWLRDEGSEVSEGDPLLTVETEKAVNDVEAPADGVLLKIVAERGAAVPVSAAVAVIAAPGESLTDAEIAALLVAAAPAKKSGAASTRASGGAQERRAGTRDASGRINASPAARKRADELEIDLQIVEATGPGGRITSDDVERAAAERDADPSPRDETITLADGRTIHALVAGPGRGEKIVFLHGLGGSVSTWQVVLGDLVEDYRVAAIDLPGHGASDKSASANYSTSAIAAAVLETIDQLKLGPVVIVGHSLGGAVALRAALERPSAVRGLALINSAGLGSEISGDLLEVMAGDPGRDGSRRLLSLFFEDQRLVVDRGIDEMAASQMAEGGWSAQRSIARLAFPNGRQDALPAETLGTISVPVEMIWGDLDRVFPVSHGFDSLTTFPDSRLRVLAGIGHVPQVESPDRISISIKRFMAALRVG